MTNFGKRINTQFLIYFIKLEKVIFNRIRRELKNQIIIVGRNVRRINNEESKEFTTKMEAKQDCVPKPFIILISIEGANEKS